MIILYDNMVFDATITGTTTDPDYPAQNLKDDRLIRTYRTTVGTAQRILFDFSEAVTANAVAILAHNIDSTATIKIEANDSNSWGAPAFSETLTHNEGAIVATFDGDEYEFWSLYINDTVNDYIEIGYVYLSDYISAPGFLPPEIKKVNTNNISFSSGGQRYSDIGYRYNEVSITFPELSLTQRTELKTVADSLSDTQTCILKIFDDGSGYDPFYCVMIDEPEETIKNNRGGYVRPFSMTFNFREAF